MRRDLAPRVSCGKYRYPSGAHARWALDVIRKRGGRALTGKKPNRAYQCDRCGGWHLTSAPA